MPKGSPSAAALQDLLQPLTCEYKPHECVPDAGAVDDVPQPLEVGQDEVVEGRTGLQQVVEARPELSWGDRPGESLTPLMMLLTAPCHGVPGVLWARGTYGRCSCPQSIPSVCSHTRILPGRPSHTPLGAGRGSSSRDSLWAEKGVTIQPQHHCIQRLPAPRGVDTAKPGPVRGMHPWGGPLQ